MTLHLSDDPPAPLHRPMVVELDDGPAADPSAAAQVPDLLPEGHAMQAAARLATRQSSAFGRFALWVFASLFTLVLTVTAWDFVAGLFLRNGLLGWLAFGLLILALSVTLILALREIASYARMAHIDRIRMQAETARTTDNLKEARAVLLSLNRLYGARNDTAWGRSRIAERQGEVFDADALLRLAETELLGPLDRAALTEVETAARQVATVTALVPLALADVATALYANMRMIRRLSEIYGGRSGSFGSWRLMRRVFSALLGAGAIALADDLIGSVAGGGILAKLSRRFGEGVVNGALTTRVGLAAMELCRPLPFNALTKPGTSATTSRALAGLFGRADTASNSA